MKNALIQTLVNKPIKLCVLATASDNQPWCAVMGYAARDDGVIILSTKKGTRKYQNLVKNSNVALVFGFSLSEPYAQCEGKARIIETGEEYTACDNFFFSVNPQAANFKSKEDIFIAVSIKKAQVIDFSMNPPKVEKMTL